MRTRCDRFCLRNLCGCIFRCEQRSRLGQRLEGASCGQVAFQLGISLARGLPGHGKERIGKPHRNKEVTLSPSTTHYLFSPFRSGQHE